MRCASGPTGGACRRTDVGMKTDPGAGPGLFWVFDGWGNPFDDLRFPTRACFQHAPPPSTRKNDSISASVPMSPSALKSAELVQGAPGHEPERQAKKASMSESVPMSPSQLKSALPQEGWSGGQGPPPTPVRVMM